MDKWTLGRRIQLDSLSLSLSLHLGLSLLPSRSLCLSGCHRTCQALMPSNLLSNTHCRLSFKGLSTGLTAVASVSSIPPTLPVSVSPFLTILVIPLSVRSLKTICLSSSITQITSLKVLDPLISFCLSVFYHRSCFSTHCHPFGFFFFLSFSLFVLCVSVLLKSNLMLPFSQLGVCLVLPPTVSCPD